MVTLRRDGIGALTCLVIGAGSKLAAFSVSCKRQKIFAAPCIKKFILSIRVERWSHSSMVTIQTGKVNELSGLHRGQSNNETTENIEAHC